MSSYSHHDDDNDDDRHYDNIDDTDPQVLDIIDILEVQQQQQQQDLFSEDLQLYLPPSHDYYDNENDKSHLHFHYPHHYDNHDQYTHPYTHYNDDHEYQDDRLLANLYVPPPSSSDDTKDGDTSTTTVTTTTTTTPVPTVPDMNNNDDDDDVNIDNDISSLLLSRSVLQLHHVPRGISHTNRLAYILSSDSSESLSSQQPQQQDYYVGGLKWFMIVFIVVPFTIWTLSLLIFKCIYGTSRVGCAAGGDHLNMKHLSRQGISRSQRKIRIQRSYRLQSTFCVVGILIPTITAVMIMYGYHPFVNQSITDIQSLNDDIETLIYRGWNSVQDITTTTHTILHKNELVRDIIRGGQQSKLSNETTTTTSSSGSVIVDQWCDRPTSTANETTTTTTASSPSLSLLAPSDAMDGEQPQISTTITNTNQEQQQETNSEAFAYLTTIMSEIEQRTIQMVQIMETYLGISSASSSSSSSSFSFTANQTATIPPPPPSSSSSLLPTDTTFQSLTATTQSIDNSITWFLQHDWIFKFIIMILNVVVILLVVIVYIFTKTYNIYHVPTRLYTSYVLTPLLCITTVALLVLSCMVGVTSMINSDFCAGSGDYDSGVGGMGVAGTFQDAILMIQYGTLDRSVRSSLSQQQQQSWSTLVEDLDENTTDTNLNATTTTTTPVTVPDDVYDVLWNSIDYYSNQCLDEDQNPFFFLNLIVDQLDNAIQEISILTDLLQPSVGDESTNMTMKDGDTQSNSNTTVAILNLLDGVCNNGGSSSSTTTTATTGTDPDIDPSGSQRWIESITQLEQSLIELRSHMITLVEDTVSCHQISPIFRRLQYGALCTTAPTGLGITWICSFVICILCFVLLSVRSALYNTIQKKKLRPYKPRHVVEREFDDYKRYMCQFYNEDDVMNGWCLDLPLPSPDMIQAKDEIFDVRNNRKLLTTTMKDVDKMKDGIIQPNPTMETVPDDEDEDAGNFLDDANGNQGIVIAAATVVDVLPIVVDGADSNVEIVEKHNNQRYDFSPILNAPNPPRRNYALDPSHFNDRSMEGEDDDGLLRYDDNNDDDSSCGSSYDSVVSDDEIFTEEQDGLHHNDDDDDEQSAMASFISETKSVAQLTVQSVQNSLLKPILNAVRQNKTVHDPANKPPLQQLSPSMSYMDDFDYDNIGVDNGSILKASMTTSPHQNIHHHHSSVPSSMLNLGKGNHFQASDDQSIDEDSLYLTTPIRSKTTSRNKQHVKSKTDSESKRFPTLLGGRRKCKTKYINEDVDDDESSVSSLIATPQGVVSSFKQGPMDDGSKSSKRNSGLFRDSKATRPSQNVLDSDPYDDDDLQGSLLYKLPTYQVSNQTTQKQTKRRLNNQQTATTAVTHKTPDRRSNASSSKATSNSGGRGRGSSNRLRDILLTPGSVISALTNGSLTPDGPKKSMSYLSRLHYNDDDDDEVNIDDHANTIPVGLSTPLRTDNNNVTTGIFGGNGPSSNDLEEETSPLVPTKTRTRQYSKSKTSRKKSTGGMISGNDIDHGVVDETSARYLTYRQQERHQPQEQDQLSEDRDNNGSSSHQRNPPPPNRPTKSKRSYGRLQFVNGTGGSNSKY